MPAQTVQKSRPAFPDGLGCTLGRLLAGGGTGAGARSTSQNPVHGILGILQVGAVGKDQLFALSQRGVERDGALIDSAVCQVGVQQGSVDLKLVAGSTNILCLLLAVLTVDDRLEVAGLDGQVVGAANGDLEGEGNGIAGQVNILVLLGIVIVGTKNGIDLQNSDGTGTIAVQVLGIGLITAGEEAGTRNGHSCNSGVFQERAARKC